MLMRALSDVTLQEVQTLCDNRVLEGRFYDFKAAAIGSNERDKREFLADVTAFANAAGGDLILGVRENAGAADEICGIDLNDPDQEKQRLINLVRDGVEPRISCLDTKWLPISGTMGVMIIRVPRGWSAPHRVVYLRDMNF
jgi:predicted HTH transcriptional regulator